MQPIGHLNEVGTIDTGLRRWRPMSLFIIYYKPIQNLVLYENNVQGKSSVKTKKTEKKTLGQRPDIMNGSLIFLVGVSWAIFFVPLGKTKDV